MDDEAKFWIPLAASLVLTVAATALPTAFQAGSVAKRLLRALMFLVIGAACLFVLWLVFHSSKSPPEPSTSMSRASALALQLAGNEWVQTGESCARDSVRLEMQGHELVAIPKGAQELRYVLMDATGQQLTTQLNGRIVIFQLGTEGFTHIDRGYEQWFRRCG